jgi:predicted dehydrogenase
MEAEDCALAIVRFASGAVGTLTASTAVFPGFAQRLEVSGTGGTVIIEDSVITYRGFRDELPDQGMTGSSVLTGATVPAVAASAADLEVAAHAAQLADLLAALDEGREPQVTAADGRATLELVCAVYESARQGRPVALPMRADGAR